MLGRGNNKQAEEEKAQQEQIAQAMKAMSDQIGKQAQTIKQLEAQLAEAKSNAAVSSATSEALAAAQAQLKQMHDEMENLKTKAAAPAAGKAAAGSVGVTKVGAGTGAVPSLGGVGNPPVTTVTGGLSVGVKAYVQKAGGKNLRLRDAAGLESHVIAGLAPGTELSLISGPVEKDGYPWWHIRTDDGREGWVAGTELVTHPE